MTRPPSHIFVVRHGSRLDAADKKWHLSSPTPYDPPLTYGGFQQGRQVGNHIWSILEQSKLEFDVSKEGTDSLKKRKRFKVVIHSSPFLRCVQTSVGISSGLAQATPGSIYIPSDVIVPPPSDRPDLNKSAILRLDSFLGEWLSPEYFDDITPPPGPALMMGGAKAELLRRVDYSSFDELSDTVTSSSSSALWSSSPGLPPTDMSTSPLSDSRTPEPVKTLMRKPGYVPLRPNYAVSSAGKIPEGFVEHSRDECIVVDYQWDSMRAPLDFGDGGKYGEEWGDMHKRFRKGLKQLVNWYCTNEEAASPVTPVKGQDSRDFDAAHDEEVETVIIIVSHGAGCNALMGAITHQPVLMDVGVASITHAERKRGTDYSQLLASHRNDPTAQYGVSVDLMYDIKASASTEHLQSTSSNPGSARSTRSPSIPNVWVGGSRGRTSTFGSIGGAVMSPFTYTDPLASAGSRSTSASATIPPFVRRNSNVNRAARVPISAIAPPTASSGDGASNSSIGSNGSAPSYGLWSPAPSSLRFMEDSGSESEDDDLPDFDQDRFKTPVQRDIAQFPNVAGSGITTLAEIAPSVKALGMPMDSPFARVPTNPKGPTLSAPIKLQTNLIPSKPVDEVKVTQLGDGFGGLWSLPRPPDDAERFRDHSLAKRRWTVNERS